MTKPGVISNDVTVIHCNHLTDETARAHRIQLGNTAHEYRLPSGVRLVLCLDCNIAIEHDIFLRYVLPRVGR